MKVSIDFSDGNLRNDDHTRSQSEDRTDTSASLSARAAMASATATARYSSGHSSIRSRIHYQKTSSNYEKYYEVHDASTKKNHDQAAAFCASCQLR